MRADRLVSIVLLLQSRERLTARQLARELEVSERTVLRDMDALSAAGIPVVADRGARGGWRLLEGYQTKLTGLKPAEIQSLFLARPARLIDDLGWKASADAALLKLEAALPRPARREAELARRRIHVDVRGWRDPAESISALPLLVEAIWRERRLSFTYAKPDCEPAPRVVDPLGLVAKGSTWYLVALVEGEPRTYRVSRISAPAVLEEASRAPAEFDLAAYWQQSAETFRKQLPRYDAVFLVEPPVLRWARYRGWRLEEETLEGDRVRIRIRFDIEEEAVQFGLSFGGAIEVVEPAELREAVVAGAREILARYSAAGTARGDDRQASATATATVGAKN
jgi:predicted DNA-binding transcriptional regulator YafY